MAKMAKRALIESAKRDIAENQASENVGEAYSKGTPFSAESFFDGIDADELFGDSLDVSIEGSRERTA